MERMENVEDIRASYTEVPKKNHYRALLKFGVYSMQDINTNHSKSILMKLLEDPIYKSAIRAMNDLDKWEYLRDFETPLNVTNVSIHTCDDPILKEIVHKIYDYYDGCHTDGSIAYTMKRMQYIAKNEMPTINYLRRRDYLLFIASIKSNGLSIIKNDDMIREICRFI